jgi:hypothetical protein
MTVAELTQNVQFTVDQNGTLTAVVIDAQLWRHILEALEESEDHALVHALRDRLRMGPIASGAIRWDDIAGQWQ